MDLDPGWEKEVAERLFLEEEKKEEKKYPLKYNFSSWLDLKVWIKVNNF